MAGGALTDLFSKSYPQGLFLYRPGWPLIFGAPPLPSHFHASVPQETILPGPLLAILGQTSTIWIALLSAVFLRRRFPPLQLVGLVAIVVGVIFTLAPSPGALALSSAVLSAAAAFVAVQLLPAACVIMKEHVFMRGWRQHPPHGYDLFVINTAGSLSQVAACILLLPLLVAAKGSSLALLPAELARGAAAFAAAPLFPLAYIFVNILFNISALACIKRTSSVTFAVALAVALPLSALVFALPLPLLAAPARPTTNFYIGLTLLVAGLLLYSLFNKKKSKHIVAVAAAAPPGIETDV